MSAIFTHRNHWALAAIVLVIVLVLFGFFLRSQTPVLQKHLGKTQPTPTPEASSAAQWDMSNQTLASMAAALGLPQVTSDDQAAAMARGGHQPYNLQEAITTHPGQTPPAPGSTYTASQMYEYGQAKDLAALAAAGATIDLYFLPDHQARINMLGREFTGTYDDYYLYADSVDGAALSSDPIKFIYIREGDEIIAGSHWVEIHFIPVSP